MDRPHTSNPKRRSLSNTPPTHGPSPTDVKPLVIEDMKEVLWSEEKGVPENILARPHTSNPRYVEMHMRDTPRKDNNSCEGLAHSGGATSTTPSDQNGQQPPSLPQQPTGILWACGDTDSIDPSLLVRPVTANPWLTRLFESGLVSLEDMTSHRGSKILWSSNDIEDWRSLARPHTSNPQREREQETSEQDAVVGEATHSAAAPQNVSEVIWAREDPEELRGIVEAQGRRIMNLEEEVSSLKQILYEVLVKLGGQVVAAPISQPPSVAPVAPAQTIATVIDVNVISGDAVLSPCAGDVVVSSNLPSPAPPPAVVAETNSVTTPQRALPPPQPPASNLVTPIRQAADEDDDDGFVVEDNSSAVEPQLVETTPSVLRPTVPTGVPRPDTATASRRVAELRETVGLLRPQSAPLSHYTDVRSRKKQDVVCFSGEGFSAQHLDNSAISKEYSRLLRSGHDLVLRQDFKEHYIDKALEMGMFVSKAEVDRKFGDKPQYLTLEEFAIHYLRIARW